LLKHVLLALAIGLERGARRFRRGVEVLHGVAALLADAIAEHEAFDLADRADVDAALLGAALRGSGRRDDAAGVVVLRRFLVGVFDDVLRQSMGPLFRTLLANVAADSSQRFILASFRSRPGTSARCRAPGAGTIDSRRAADTAVRPSSRNGSSEATRPAPGGESCAFRTDPPRGHMSTRRDSAGPARSRAPGDHPPRRVLDRSAPGPRRGPGPA